MGYPYYGGGYGQGRGWRRGQGAGQGRGYGWRGRRQPMVPQQMLTPLPPPPPGAIRVAAPTIDDRGLEAIIDQRFGRAPFITIVDIVNGNPVNVTSIPNPYATAPGGGAGIALAQWMLASRVNILITPYLGPHASMVLQQAGIRMIPAQPGARVIDMLRMNGLIA